MQSLAAKPGKGGRVKARKRMWNTTLEPDFHVQPRLGIAELLQSSQVAFLFGPGLAGSNCMPVSRWRTSRTIS